MLFTEESKNNTHHKIEIKCQRIYQIRMTFLNFFIFISFIFIHSTWRKAKEEERERERERGEANYPVSLKTTTE